MTPQTVNAYYHPLKNEIVFPAAILQPPFFNADADDAVNYGGIGAVIGHEIGHGFDDQGSTCDGDGALRDWWTEEDREAFEQRTAALVEQYDALEPEQAPGHHVNGQAHHRREHRRPRRPGHRLQGVPDRPAGRRGAELLDGYTPEQRLFLSWGAVWQTKIRTEMLLQRLATDPHSPGGVPVQPDRAQPGRVLRRVRRDRVRRAVAGRGSAGQDLVNLGWRVAPLAELVDQVRGRSDQPAAGGRGRERPQLQRQDHAGRAVGGRPAGCGGAAHRRPGLAPRRLQPGTSCCATTCCPRSGPGRRWTTGRRSGRPGAYGLDHPAGRAGLPVRGGRRRQPGLGPRRLRPGLLGGDRRTDPVGARPGPAGRRRDVRRRLSTAGWPRRTRTPRASAPGSTPTCWSTAAKSTPSDPRREVVLGRRSEDLADLPGARHLGRVQPGVVTLIGCPLK